MMRKIGDVGGRPKIFRSGGSKTMDRRDESDEAHRDEVDILFLFY